MPKAADIDLHRQEVIDQGFSVLTNVIPADKGSQVCAEVTEAAVGNNIAHVPAGRLVADGSRIVPADGETIKSRIRTMWNGFSVVTVALNGEGLKGEPQIWTTGVFEDENN